MNYLFFIYDFCINSIQPLSTSFSTLDGLTHAGFPDFLNTRCIPSLHEISSAEIPKEVCVLGENPNSPIGFL
jgi:hypothetical protein